MSTRLELLQQESRGMMLDAAERNAMRHALMSHMQKVPMHAPVRSNFFARHAVLLGTIGVVVLAGAGVTYAAESAVPGDALYTMKRNVNERVQGYFAFSDERKAQLEVSFAERRLEEAETLHAKSALSQETKTQIVTDFNLHMKNASMHVSELAKKNDFEAAQATARKLEKSINTHAEILPVLSLVGSSNVEATSSIDTETTVQLP